MLGDPAAGGELLEQCLVELARRAVVHVLDGRLAVAQPGRPEPALARLVLRLAASRSSTRRGRGPWRDPGLQLGEGVRHAVELELAQLVDGRRRRLCRAQHSVGDLIRTGR